MSYRINVASGNRHVFCTGETITSESDAIAIAIQLEKAYPKPAYRITVTQEYRAGTQVYDNFNDEE